MFCKNWRQALVQGPRAAFRFFTGRRRLTLLKHREALGDCLMMTALGRALKRHVPDVFLSIASSNPEVFLHNPHFDEVRGWHFFRTRSTVRLNYRLENARHEHYVEQMWMDLWDLLVARGWASGPRAPLEGRHPEIFLTEPERARGRERLDRKQRAVVVLTSGGKLKPTHNREWGYENHVALAHALAPHVDLVQISGDRELLLPDGRGPVRNVRTGIREVAALLEACDAFVTQEGGLMHVARAVDAPTAVIYGGTLVPEHSGYDRMVNLASHPECSPCRHTRQNCAHLKCMVPITPRVVIREVAGLLKARNCLLPDEAIQAAPDHWEPPSFVNREILKAECARI